MHSHCTISATCDTDGACVCGSANTLAFIPIFNLTSYIWQTNAVNINTRTENKHLLSIERNVGIFKLLLRTHHIHWFILFRFLLCVFVLYNCLLRWTRVRHKMKQGVEAKAHENEIKNTLKKQSLKPEILLGLILLRNSAHNRWRTCWSCFLAFKTSSSTCRDLKNEWHNKTDHKYRSVINGKRSVTKLRTHTHTFRGVKR